MAISMLKIRRPLGRLIFNMGIAIPGKTVFLIETAPWSPYGSDHRTVAVLLPGFAKPGNKTAAVPRPDPYGIPDRSLSTSVWVMACCLMTPSHH